MVWVIGPGIYLSGCFGASGLVGKDKMNGNIEALLYLVTLFLR